MNSTVSLDSSVITKEEKALLRLSRSSSIPLVDLNLLDIPDSVLSFVPSALAVELLALPVYVKTDEHGRRTLYVAVQHPCCEATLEALADVTGLRVRPLLAKPSHIAAAIVECYGVDVPVPVADTASAA